MEQSYMKLLEDFAKFLSENNFKWEYQNTPAPIANGAGVKPGTLLSEEKQAEYYLLLYLFLKKTSVVNHTRTDNVHLPEEIPNVLRML